MDQHRPVRPRPFSSAKLNDAATGVTWLALPLFVVVTLIAVVGEMFTKFGDAGFGYYFIMLGMPAFCIAWLSLVLYSMFRTIPSSWAMAALISAALIIVGYTNIG